MRSTSELFYYNIVYILIQGIKQFRYTFDDVTRWNYSKRRLAARHDYITIEITKDYHKIYYNENMREYIPQKAKLIPKQAECKFRGELFDVYQWPQKLFDGSMSTFEMLKRDDTVVIVGILTPEEQSRLGKVSGTEDKVVITYQTQPHQDWFYDYPGGRHDDQEETELEAAKREMREETGLQFQNWRLMEVYQPFSKIDWLVYTFLATGLVEQCEQSLDAGEKVEVMEVTLSELLEYAAKPNAKHLLPNFMREIKSLDELKNLPALREY